MNRALGAIPVALLLAACAGGSPTAEPAVADSADLTVVDLKCGSQGATQFEVSPEFGGAILGGTLTLTDGKTSLFVCDAGSDNVDYSCTERPSPDHSGRWHVDVTHDASGKQAAHLDRGAGGAAEDIACASAAPDGPVLPYATIAPYVKQTCGGCHGDQFDSLDKVKQGRESMLGMITSGSMPRFKPEWKDSAEGKAVIVFLTKSPELE